MKSITAIVKTFAIRSLDFATLDLQASVQEALNLNVVSVRGESLPRSPCR